MKKILIGIFTLFYLSVQLSAPLCCLTDYVKKEISERAYNNHLKNLPSRFNLLAELGKAKEHQQQQNNFPDFNHQVTFSEYHQPQNNFKILIKSKDFHYSFNPVSKTLLGFLKCFSPPPDGALIG